MSKKESIEMSDEQIDAFIKSITTRRVPLWYKVVSFILGLWATIFAITSVVVLTKLMLEAWKWIL